MEDEKEQRSQEEQARLDRAYSEIAILIAIGNVPRSKRTDLPYAPGELPDTPERWIANYAEGLASPLGGTLVTKEEAIQGIRAAFEKQNNMTPEAYADGFTPETKHNSRGQGWLSALKKAAERTISPDGRHERERDEDKSR